MIRRTTTYLMVMAGLTFAGQAVNAQIFARIRHEQPVPDNRACGPNVCPPRGWAGYHAEVWRRWPGQVDLEELNLSPFATPNRSDLPNVSVPDPRDENSFSAPPRDEKMDIAPISPPSDANEAPSIPAPSTTAPSVPSTTAPSLPDDGGLPSDDGFGMESLPDTSGTSDLPDLDGGSGGDGGLDDLLPGGDALESPAELEAPLDEPTPNSDNLDDFLDGLGQTRQPTQSLTSSSRRQSDSSPRFAITERANPLRTLGLDAPEGVNESAATESTEGAVPASYASTEPAEAHRAPYRPRRQATMRSINDAPPRPRHRDQVRREPIDERYERDPRRTDADYYAEREYRDDPAYAPEYRDRRYDEQRYPERRVADARDSDRRYDDREYDDRRNDDRRYDDRRYNDRRYDEAEYRQRRDRYDVAEQRERRLQYRRSAPSDRVIDRDVQPTEHVEPVSPSATPASETQQRRSPTTGRVNPLRAR